MVTLTRNPPAHARQAEVAKPENTPYKLNAGDGLFLQVIPNGSNRLRLRLRLRLRYFYLGKAKMLSVGLLPAKGLQAAKDARDVAKRVLAQVTDPSQRRANEKAASLLAQENSFQVVAEEWLGRQTDKAEATRTKSEWLLRFAIVDFGSRPIKDITPKMPHQSHGVHNTMKCNT